MAFASVRIKVLWLGFAVPDEIARPLFTIDPSPAIQTHKFGWSFARSLRHGFDEVSLASCCPVQNYPLVNRLIFGGGTFTSFGMRGVMLGFFNVLLLKHFTRLASCLFVVLPQIKRERINWIFIHGLHTPYLIFGLLVRLFGCRIAVVLTDPPGIVLSTDGRISRLLKGLDAFLVKRILSCTDAVFALAPDLALRMAPTKPALIMPGILESTFDAHVSALDHSSVICSIRPFIIIYAGGLSQAYGVDRLIEAVRRLPSDVSVLLKLYGKGDQVDKIMQLTAENSRFFYGGFVDSNLLLPELCAADLLINPRPSDSFFSAQSFPSKLIEYLATCRPVLTTRIASIPENLKKYFFFIDDESPDGICNSILKMYCMPLSDGIGRGNAAQSYVRAHFSEEATGRSIARFIENLS